MSENRKRFFDEFDFPNYEDWKSSAISALKGAPFDKVMFTQTYEGITLKPIYNKEDVEQVLNVDNEFPGISPYLRGTNASGYKGINWEISQNIPYPMPDKFNLALLNDLKMGQNSIRLNIEKATAIHEDFMSEDISGYELLVSNINDLRLSFDKVFLSEFPVNIDAGVGFLPAFSALIAHSKDQIKPEDLKGTLNSDFITESTKEGIFYDNLERFINELYAVTLWAKENTPKFKTIGIKPYEWHNSGANAVQESAIAIALGVYYIKQLLHKGLNIDEIAQNMSFSFAIGVNFFMEIAKFRSVRLLWSRIIKEFGGNEESQKMHIHAITSERELTKLDPYVNLLRSTSQVFSAVMGNCDAITVNNFDKFYGLPNDFSRRIVRNTQNVIKYESHLDDTIDPVAGSFYVESLTNEMIKSVWNEFLNVENSGGILSVIENGSIQEKINLNFNKRIENLSFRKDIIVGVNKYANVKEKIIDTTFTPDREEINTYIKNFELFLNNRDLEKIDKILDEFEIHFENEPLKAVELAISAISSGATLGELYNSVPTPETEVKVVEPIMLKRSSESFENLRDLSNEYIEINGTNPKLDFVCFGNLRDWKARADFANDFFAVGGFTSNIIDGLFSVEDAVKSIDFKEKRFIVVCSTDEIYSNIIPEFAKSVKENNSESFIILAGYPKDMIDTYKNSGVDMFIHIKANIIDCLNELYQVYGLIN